MADQAAAELELRDYLRVLNRRKWTVAFATVVVLSAALATTLLKDPVYQGTAEVLLQPRSTESLFDPNTGGRSDPTRAVQTEIQVLKSQPVRAEVRRRIGRDASITAGAVGQTDVIRIKARDVEPARAAAIANAFANSYIDFRRKQAVDDLLAAGQELQSKVDSLQTQINELTHQIDSTDPKARGEVEARVRPQVSSLMSQQALFKQKLDQLQVDAALKTGGVQLVTPASAPTDPVEPKPVRTGAVALVLGLMLGVGLAFLFDYLDESIKGKEDMERAAAGIPVLGFIPAVASWKDREETRLVSMTDASSPASEAYRSLRTSVQFLGLDRPLKAVVMTSAGAGEGKTTTLANLAVALARAGQHVIVVCCDLRRPRIHEFFGLSNATGFTSVMLGEVPLSVALQPVRGSAKLRLLASGPLPPNPSELLASERAVELFDSLRKQSDIVLIDAPPVLPVTDATVLSNRVDATLLVATANVTTRKALARAVEVLSHVEAPLVGTVLNGVDAEGGYGYGYGYGYYQQEPDKARRTSRRKAQGEAAAVRL